MFDYEAEQLLAQREREMRTLLLTREVARQHDRVRSGLRAAFASRLVRLALALHPAAAVAVLPQPRESVPETPEVLTRADMTGIIIGRDAQQYCNHRQTSC